MEGKDYALDAQAILAGWDKKTKIRVANELIKTLMEDIKDLEIQIVANDVCRRFLSKDETEAGVEDREELMRKRGSLDLLIEWRDILEKFEVIKGRKTGTDKTGEKVKREMPSYMKVIKGGKDREDKSC